MISEKQGLELKGGDDDVRRAVSKYLYDPRSIDDLEAKFARDVVEKLKHLVVNDAHIGSLQEDASVRTGSNKFIICCSADHAFKQDTFIETFGSKMDRYRVGAAINKELEPYGLTTRKSIEVLNTKSNDEISECCECCDSCCCFCWTCGISRAFVKTKQNTAREDKMKKLKHSTSDTYKVEIDLSILPSVPKNNSSGARITRPTIKDSFTSRSSMCISEK